MAPPAPMSIDEFDRLYGETSLLFEEEVDRLLNQERDALLAMARSGREWLQSLPAPFRLGETRSATRNTSLRRLTQRRLQRASRIWSRWWTR